MRSFELLTIERLFGILAASAIKSADNKGNELSLKIIVMTSHNKDDINTICTHVFTMTDGVLQETA